MADLHFTIVHYAGKVTYDTEGFIVKNRAISRPEDMLRSSSASIVRKLGDDPLEQGGSFFSRSPAVTVFRNEIHSFHTSENLSKAL